MERTATEPKTQDPQSEPTEHPSEKAICSNVLRHNVLPLTIVAIAQIGSLLSLPKPELLIWVSNLLLFLYLGWRWEARHAGSLQQGIARGIGVGLALGFIVAIAKFIVDAKFYTIFYFITDPLLTGGAGGLIMGATIAGMRSPKLQPLLQHFKSKS